MLNTSWLTSVLGSVRFSKRHLSSVEDQSRYVGGPDTFGDYEARRFRCALFKALYQNTAYDSGTHSWANSRNRGSGLYKYTRGTNCPAYRLAEVFATHVFNGRLDMKAGDGRTTPSAIPIDTENESLRRPIARFWRDSNMQIAKSILSRTGAVCGDAPFYLHDNVRKRRIEGEPLDPSCLEYVGRDNQGNVTGYIRREYRPNPTYDPARRHADERATDPESNVDDRAYVLYTEYCWREAETIIFQTYREGDKGGMERFNWRGKNASGEELPWQWEVEYGFVPLVIVPHVQSWPGQAWGFSEFHGILAKVDEVNDLGSKLHDQIRKVVEGAWFFAGVQPPKAKPTIVEADAEAGDDSQPGRQEMKVIYAPTGATAQELVIPLDIQFASIEIMNQRAELEMDSPVLRFDRLRSQVSGDASAKALREARKPAEGAIQERRASYDDLLVRAHKMAISMGSMKGYPEYEGFTPDAYEDGDLDHAVGFRSVYGVDPIDQAELDVARGNAVVVWKSAGVPPRLALEMSGWTEKQLEAFDEAESAQQEKVLENQKAMIALSPPVPDPAAKKSPSPSPNGRPVPVLN